MLPLGYSVARFYLFEKSKITRHRLLSNEVGMLFSASQHQFPGDW